MKSQILSSMSRNSLILPGSLVSGGSEDAPGYVTITGRTPSDDMYSDMVMITASCLLGPMSASGGSSNAPAMAALIPLVMMDGTLTCPRPHPSQYLLYAIFTTPSRKSPILPLGSMSVNSSMKLHSPKYGMSPKTVC